jgi:AcrR family transcriptional regulator
VHAEQRTRILRTAVDLFARQGYEATGMRAIADAVDLRPATLYYYFPSKDDLMAALLTDDAQELRGRIEAAPVGETLRDVLTNAGASFLRGHADLPAKQRLEVALIAAHHRSDWAERYLAGIADPGHARLAERIARVLPKGADVDPRMLATQVIGALLSFVLHEEMLRRQGENSPDRDAYLRQLVEVVAGGVERMAAT